MIPINKIMQQAPLWFDIAIAAYLFPTESLQALFPTFAAMAFNVNPMVFTYSSSQMVFMTTGLNCAYCLTVVLTIVLGIDILQHIARWLVRKKYPRLYSKKTISESQ